MSNIKPISVSELAERVSGRVVGDGAVVIERVADLANAGVGEIAYLDNEKFFSAATESSAACLIIPMDANAKVAFKSPALIEVSNPKLAFALVAEILHPPVRREPSIHPSAVIAETADIALTAVISPHDCIGEYARVCGSTGI